MQNYKQSTRQPMSDQNPNRRSNNSENREKLLQTIRDLENKNDYFKRELERYGWVSPDHGSSFTAVNKDNETVSLVKTSNATKEGKEELQTSDTIHQSRRQVIPQPPDAKPMRGFKEQVVWSKRQKSRSWNPKQNEKVKREKPKKVHKKLLKEFANYQETSIIYGGCYTSILLPLWIPSCL